MASLGAALARPSDPRVSAQSCGTHGMASAGRALGPGVACTPCGMSSGMANLGAALAWRRPACVATRVLCLLWPALRAWRPTKGALLGKNLPKVSANLGRGIWGLALYARQVLGWDPEPQRPRHGDQSSGHAVRRTRKRRGPALWVRGERDILWRAGRRPRHPRARPSRLSPQSSTALAGRDKRRACLDHGGVSRAGRRPARERPGRACPSRRYGEPSGRSHGR